MIAQDLKLIAHRNKNAENKKKNDTLSQTNTKKFLESYIFKLHKLTVDAVVEVLNALFHNTPANHVIGLNVLKSFINVCF